MEKIINKRVEEYSICFKEKIKEKINSLNIYENDKTTKLLDFIYRYDPLVFEKEDLLKPKRVKVEIASNIRCTAKRINGEQCTRRKRSECDYCGTHYKTLPFGVFESDKKSVNNTLSIDVFTKDIQGIVYYIDNDLNVYNTEDILTEKHNPKIIAKAEQIDGIYTISDLGLF